MQSAACEFGPPAAIVVAIGRKGEPPCAEHFRERPTAGLPNDPVLPSRQATESLDPRHHRVLVCLTWPKGPASPSQASASFWRACSEPPHLAPGPSRHRSKRCCAPTTPRRCTASPSSPAGSSPARVRRAHARTYPPRPHARPAPRHRAPLSPTRCTHLLPEEASLYAGCLRDLLRDPDRLALLSASTPAPVACCVRCCGCSATTPCRTESARPPGTPRAAPLLLAGAPPPRTAPGAVAPRHRRNWQTHQG